MDRSRSKFRSYGWLLMLVGLSVAACSSPSNIVTQSPIPQPLSTLSPQQPTPPPVQQNDGEVYQQALTKADAANAIGQSALSKDDWLLVAHNLQDSVEMLKSIVPTSSQFILAAKVLPKYERELEVAREKSASFVSKPSKNPVVSSQIASTPPSDTFIIPITQKLGGVPVIEVTFNDNYKAAMLLDTGASHTLITQSTADRLKLETRGTSQAKTANGTATFQVSRIDKIKFGDGETKNVRVAIGQKDLPYGLLGHDVYDGYDITIKESAIEFHKR
ncbi:retropepsin-like aspartic protease [Chamaesiphon sp. VAR_48_metabat_135_sub]|uniref:retropepsin-like aspartic protease family protein n=1 Tax=Chamaesiphon sp. VAR_48_metabat_135_sub TaxID=2964699 RepID=UPI00286AF0A8|nr:retropepsin-like aspartic protease [Chamaesiphon sp. VAR_48_metabat_135_sub]